MKSRVFAIMIGFFLSGVAFQGFILIDSQTSFILSLVLLVATLFVIKKKYLVALIGGLGFLFLGVSLSLTQFTKFVSLNELYSKKEVEIVAVVDDIPTKTEFGQLAKIKTHEIGGSNKELIFLAYLRGDIKYREVIRFTAQPNKYKKEKQGQLIRQKVVADIYVNKFEEVGIEDNFTLRSCLFNLRQKINASIYRALPDDEANLASGLILGEKALISEETKRLLQAGGLSHIIALSGYNITILLGMFVFIKNRFSRMANLVIPLLFILSFVIMTGGSASIIRAGIMGFMPILAKFLHRPQNSFMAIIFSAFLMVIFNPSVLLYDVGFQLSFAAMFGLCYLAPIIQNLFNKDSNLINLLSETLGAQLSVLPLLVYYFGLVSVISPLSNLVILSFIPLGMFVSFLVGIFGLINQSLGQLIALPSYIILKSINSLIFLFGSFNFSSIQIKIENPWWILIGYLALFNFYLFFKKVNVRS